MHRGILVPIVLAFMLVVGGASASSGARSRVTHASAIPLAPAFTASQLNAHAGANWLSVQGDLQNNRYSTLTQINRGNVGKLKMAWHIHLGDCPTRNQLCSGEEENATVYKGVMYLEDVHSQVFALNAATGKTIWKVDPTWLPGYKPGAGGRKPGVSIGQGLVFRALV